MQEHQLSSRELCDDAEQWCLRRGWSAVFRPALRLPSGRTSGGVAILVAQRADLGVTSLELQAGDHGHRLLGLRLTASGLEPMLLVSAYFQAAVGLNETNRTLLATVAQWQEIAQLPVIMGGDFNLKPDLLHDAQFFARSGMRIVAPREATHRTRSSTSVIDFFVMSSCLHERVASIQAESEFPPSPHSPVRLVCNAGLQAWKPILESPTKLPTERPFGPSKKLRPGST